MPVEWREENGLTFLYADYRGQTVEEDHATFAESLRQVEASPPGVRLLIHVDPNHRPDSRFLADVKREMRATLAPRGTRVAFIGIAGIGRAVISGLNLVGSGMGVTAFPTWDKAIAYLSHG